MKHLVTVVAASAFLTISADAATIGNDLIPRTYATDYSSEFGQGNLALVLDFTSPVAGNLTSFQTFGQLPDSGGRTSAGRIFDAYVFRPQGGDQYYVAYDSGPLTPVLLGVNTFAVPNFALQIGDVIAHFGEGIPVDIDPSGTGVLHYPVSLLSAPQVGQTITLPSGTYPDYNQSRTYSIAANVPDGGSTAILLGLGTLGLAGLVHLRRKLLA